MINHSTFKCILFNCDNVLVDTETVFVSVLMDMAGTYGVEMEAEEALKLFCGRKIGEAIEILEKLCPQKLPADFEHALGSKLHDEFRLGIAPVEGAAQFLTALKLPYCIASGSPREKIWLSLKLTKLDKFFKQEHIFSFCDMDNSSTLPAIFLHAAQRMGYFPEQCAVIESSIAGINAAVAGGFRVFGLGNGMNTEALEQQGATVFESISELPMLLGLTHI